MKASGSEGCGVDSHGVALLVLGTFASGNIRLDSVRVCGAVTAPNQRHPCRSSPLALPPFLSIPGECMGAIRLMRIIRPFQLIVKGGSEFTAKVCIKDQPVGE